jgi:hypothetical protein
MDIKVLCGLDSTIDSLTGFRVNGTALAMQGQFEDLALQQILRRVKREDKGMEYTLSV